MHRALLLFVSRYASTDWPDLEFLSTEYEGVQNSLSSHGYVIDERSVWGELHASTLNERIQTFIREACQTDHLLVYLSGHGFHFDRAHWFAAHNSDLTGKQTMRVTNVRLDDGWPDLVEESEAEQVLFVIDACRDRLVDSDDTYHLPAVSPPEGSERLTYLMACAPEQPAAFVTPDHTVGGTFSLFTQAFREVLSDADGPLPVDLLRRMMEGVMDELQSRHCNSALTQVPRLSGEEGALRFPVLPDRKLVSTRNLAATSPAWQMAISSHETGHEVQLVCSRLDDNFQEERRLLASDPWIDWEAYGRASKNLDMLIGYLPDAFEFSPVEAATLVLLPHLYHGFRVRLARQVDQILNRSFERLDGAHEAWAPYPRLQRQTEARLSSKRGRRDRKVADAWVLHQHLARPGDAHKHEDELLRYLDVTLAGTDELSEVLTIDTVSWLFRAMFYGGSTLAEEPDFHPSGRGGMRHQMIGYLLAASQAMALDIAELPSVLVEHSGGTDRISFLQIRETIRKARWQAAGRTLRLEARCPHQAVMVALQERAESLDGLLYTATGIEGLEKLPNRASGDAVGPEEDSQTGRLKFLPVATRFGLDGTRVRDLLAGEQLYSDKSLAIRELYQNALDACNVRKARETFRPSERGEAWDGRIEIRQGSLGAVQFIECTDNGSGMGRGELLHAFAQGGVRLSHLMEFQEEKLQWRRKGIQFHENSRFGIGVLSYFMLADEIEVVTRKFHRDRSLGRILKVTITGPDNLFHVEEKADAVDFLDDPCGTRVRLYLRNDIHEFSCVTALRPVLGVAKYTTAAVSEEEHEVWNPNVYISRTGSFDQGRIDASGSVIADPGGDVFWCEHGGTLLVDGIAVEGSWGFPADRIKREDRANAMKIPGAVVNLAGPVIISEGQGKRTPRLTVDRNQIIDDVFKPVAKRLRAATASLRSAEFLTSTWLEKAAVVEPQIADVIVEGLIDLNTSLSYDDGVAPMGSTGYFPGDEVFRADWQSANPIERDSNHDPLLQGIPRTDQLPPHLSLWRYAAHFPDEVKRCLGDLCPMDWDATVLRPALPTDAVVLGGTINALTRQYWDTASSLGRALRSSWQLHRDLMSVIRQLEDLGRPVPFPDSALSLPRPALYSLLATQAGNADYQPLPQDRPISPVSLLQACHAAKIAVSDAIECLTELGFDVSHCTPLRIDGSAAAELSMTLLSDRFDGKAPWFTGNFDSRRIITASEKLELSIGEVVTAYSHMGYRPPIDSYLGADYRLYRSLSPSCIRSGKAHVADVVRGAYTIGVSPAEAAKRIRAFGHEIEGEVPHVLPESAALLTQTGGVFRRLDPTRPVTLPELNYHAKRRGTSMERVAHELQLLGFVIPFEHYPEDLTDDDVAMLAEGLETSEFRDLGWLNPVEKVPLAHILFAAKSLGKSPEHVSDRLVTLGMRVADIPHELPRYHSDYRVIGLLRDWIPYSWRRPVPLGIILWVATWAAPSVPDAVRFLGDIGLVVSTVPDGLEQVDEIDMGLLRGFGTYGIYDISFVRRISTGAVVQAAAAANVSVSHAQQRLIELGAQISRPGTHSHHHSDRDLFTGIPPETTSAPAALVMIVADRCNCSPFDVSLRLQAAGIVVQEFQYPTERPDHSDLIMLRVKASVEGDYLEVTKPVSLEHILLAAHRLGWSVRDVADRLSCLGIPVADIESAVKSAWKSVPKGARTNHFLPRGK
ncbi:caspase family protein [Streptomyces griseofuscus]|uniref:wHTH domain-containing protein n=1 Tax=Streptomyces griseofuscus TaxID=146922 RepID=UPI0036C522C5